MSGFDELLMGAQSPSLEAILAELMDSKNIEMKTEIPNPPALDALMVLADAMKAEGYETCYNTLVGFVERYLLYMVSYDRKRSGEIVQAFQQMYQHELTMGDRMLGRGGDLQ